MYAIIEITGKQYKVEKDMTLNVNKLGKPEGSDIVIDKVLVFADGDKVMIGEPYLKNVKVSAKVLGEKQGKKVLGVRFKKRKNFTRTLGQRADYSVLKISELAVV